MNEVIIDGMTYGIIPEPFNYTVWLLTIWTGLCIGVFSMLMCILMTWSCIRDIILCIGLKCSSSFRCRVNREDIDTDYLEYPIVWVWIVLWIILGPLLTYGSYWLLKVVTLSLIYL